MAIKVDFGFERTADEPIDSSQVLTKAEMKNMNDSKMPDVYFAVCKDDKKMYVYNKSATPSAETGKFSVVEGGGGDVYQYSIDSTNPNFQPVSGQTDAYVMNIPDADWDAIWAAKNAGKVVVVRVEKLYDATNGDDGLAIPMVFGNPTTNPYGSGFGYYMEEPGGLSENRLVVVTLQKTSVAKVYLQYFTVGGGSGGGNADFALDTDNDFATIQNQNQGMSFDFSDANGVTITASDPGTYQNSKKLATQDYVNNKMPVIVGSDWGVAKVGSNTFPLNIGSVTIDISDLNLSSASDYDVFITPTNSNVDGDTVFYVTKTDATKFTIGRFSSSKILTFRYVVLAKGYGSTPSGGTTGQVLTKKSDASGDVEWADGGGGGAFVIDTANPCSYNELQSAINAPKVILIKHEGTVYPFVEKWESDENTKRYVNIASLQRQSADKGAMYFFFEATIGDFDSPMAYSSNYVQPTGKPYTDSVAGNLTNLITTEKANLVGAVNEVNGKTGVNIAVGKETWYGTYTDENDVTYQVYTKTVYIPALPASAGTTKYEHGVANIRQILSIYGFTTDGFVLNAPRQNAQDNIAIYQASKGAGNLNFSIEVGKDRSSKSAYVTMIYAKNN